LRERRSLHIVWFVTTSENVAPARAPRWYHYVAYFFGGAFVANAVPHFVSGISGRAFQSPFASPPGEGLSSSTVNVLWGLFNLAVGYVLTCRIGTFELRKTRHVLVFTLGVLLMSIMLAHAFGRFYGGNEGVRAWQRVSRGS
jgi:hypothetical protein